MRRVLLVILFCAGLNIVSATGLRKAGPVGSETYSTGIGLRGGFASGITVKHFLHDNAAIEGIISPHYYKGTWITGLYELHVQAFSVQGLNWFFGGGAHIGFVSDFIPIGLDGIVGLEYKIFEIPFTIGIDLKPTLNFTYAAYPLLMDGAVTLRYAF